MASVQPFQIPPDHDDSNAMSRSPARGRGPVRRPRRKVTAALVAAAMLALFGGVAAVESVASAAVTNDAAAPAHAVAAGQKWASDTWHAPAVPGVGAWPTTSIDVATQVETDASGAATRALRGILGGAVYNDRDGQLTNFILAHSPPGCTPDPSKFEMHEYDVNDRPWGGPRDQERIVHVTGACISSYDFYTPDHYANFSTFATY